MNEKTARALQSMRDSFAQAATGPLLTTTLVPLTHQGNLRMRYPKFDHGDFCWMALNCDPNDGSSFIWVISKLDDTHVSLSPQDDRATFYASVRDDWSWFVQMQKPISADMITEVGRNETILMQPQGLNIVQFQGFNGQNIAVNEQISYDDLHPGYRLQSIGSSNPKASLWFMGVSRVLQSGLQMRLASEMTSDDIRACYASCGLTASDDDVARMMKAIA